jgi:hypothetical protein
MICNFKKIKCGDMNTAQLHLRQTQLTRQLRNQEIGATHVLWRSAHKNGNVVPLRIEHGVARPRRIRQNLGGHQVEPTSHRRRHLFCSDSQASFIGTRRSEQWLCGQQLMVRTVKRSECFRYEANVEKRGKKNDTLFCSSMYRLYRDEYTKRDHLAPSICADRQARDT